MNLGIEGKLALVVGATGDTGRAVALELGAAGCRVMGVARDAERLVALRAELAKFWPYRSDITEAHQVDGLVSSIHTDHGAPDIIVHVAGGSAGVKDALLPSSEWAKVWQLNLGAAIDINRAFIPAMLLRGWGRIVHFSSNGVSLAIGNCPYTSAKSAVEGYVRTISKQFSARGVVISAVRPGPIYTEGRPLYSQAAEQKEKFLETYVPMRRWGRGEEIAGAVAFLCSERASYMAGSIVDVDGGMR